MIFLITLGGIELFALLILLAWRSVLKEQEMYIEEAKRRCYVCITGASVTSFGDATGSFCNRHRAHLTLINSLEQREREYREWLDIEDDINKWGEQ